MSLLHKLKSTTALASNRDGSAAIEFALVFPIMATLFMGSYEITSVLLADMKLTAAAQTAADLVAQTFYTLDATGNPVALQQSDFNGFVNATQQVITPLPATAGNGTSLLKLAFASVTYNTATPVIDWHYETGGATAISLAHVPNAQDLTKLGTASTPESVIIVQAQYTYTSPTTYLLKTAFNLSESAFDRPRYETCVSTWLNNPPPCPAPQ